MLNLGDVVAEARGEFPGLGLVEVGNWHPAKVPEETGAQGRDHRIPGPHCNDPLDEGDAGTDEQEQGKGACRNVQGAHIAAFDDLREKPLRGQRQAEVDARRHERHERAQNERASVIAGEAQKSNKTCPRKLVQLLNIARTPKGCFINRGEAHAAFFILRHTRT